MNDAPPSGNRVRPLLLMSGIFFFNFLARIVFAPMAPTIEKDLGISHSAAGSFFLLISMGYFVALAGAGFVSARLTHRRTIILSSVALGSVLFVIAGGSSLWALRATMVSLGLAAGLYLPSGIATLTALITPQNWGKALAVHELAPNLAFVAAPLVVEALLRILPWRLVLAVIGGMSILMGLAFVRFGRGGRFAGQAPSAASIAVLLRSPNFWRMVLLFGLGVAGTLGIYTMLPLFLVTEHGFDRDWANTLVALSRVSGLFMALLAGWLNDRVGPRRTLAGVFVLVGTATLLLGLLSGRGLVVLLFAQPMLAVCFFPSAFAALSSSLPPATRNLGVSLTVPIGFLLGGGVAPTFIGFMGDAGAFGQGIAAIGVLMFLGLWLALRLDLAESPVRGVPAQGVPND